MATYLIEFLDPMGQALTAQVLELEEDVDGIDQLTPFGMEEGIFAPWKNVRRSIRGGLDSRAPYSIRVVKKD